MAKKKFRLKNHENLISLNTFAEWQNIFLQKNSYNQFLNKGLGKVSLEIPLGSFKQKSLFKLWRLNKQNEHNAEQQNIKKSNFSTSLALDYFSSNSPHCLNSYYNYSKNYVLGPNFIFVGLNLVNSELLARNSLVFFNPNKFFKNNPFNSKRLKKNKQKLQIWFNFTSKRKFRFLIEKPKSNYSDHDLFSRVFFSKNYYYSLHWSNNLSVRKNLQSTELKNL